MLFPAFTSPATGDTLATEKMVSPGSNQVVLGPGLSRYNAIVFVETFVDDNSVRFHVTVLPETDAGRALALE